MFRELRLAFRQFGKAPLVFGIVVATLALGIGANIAIFALLDSVLLRTLPVPRPSELVWLTNTGAYGTEAYSPAALFKAYRDDQQLPATLIAFNGPQPYELRHDLVTTTVEGELVTGNYFATLNVQPSVGRLMAADDELSAPEVVLGYAFWKREFQEDAAVVGKQIIISGLPYTVVGVAPEGFFGTVVGNSPDLYFPIPADGPMTATDLVIMARLRPGTTPAQLQAALGPDFQRISNERVTRVAAVLPALAPLIRQLFTRPVVFDASRGISQLRVRLALPLRILMSVVVLVLLIGCINLASLLIMRGTRRRKDFSLRLALGATRWDIARGVLVETVLMVAAGCAFGVLVGDVLLKVLTLSIAQDAMPGVVHTAPISLSAGLNARVFLFAVLLLGVTTLLSGLAPALLTMRGGVGDELKMSGYQLTRKSSRFGRVLAVSQIAVLVVLLFGASLLLHSFHRLETAQVGFNTDHTAVLTLKEAPPTLSEQEAKSYEHRLHDFETQFAARAAALPGVESVALSSAAPMSGAEGAPVDVAVATNPNPARLHPDVFYSWVSPGYFRTLQIPILAGREFSAEDSTRGAVQNAVINRTLAQRLFGDRDVLGQRFRVALTGQIFEVIGVAEDARFHDLREGPVPLFYHPVASARVIEIRGNADPAILAGTLRQLAASIDKGVAVESVNTMRQQIGHSLYRDRLVARFTGWFGVLALTFAVLGIYGLLASEVRRRTAEIGVRMAMGATARRIFEMVVGRGVRFGFAGTAVGGTIAACLTYVFRSIAFGADAFNHYKPGATGAENFIHIDKAFLYGISPWDPLTCIAVPVLVMAVCAVAAFVPARRASVVNPNEALRAE